MASRLLVGRLLRVVTIRGVQIVMPHGVIDNRGQSAKQICGLVNPGMAEKEWGMMHSTLQEARLCDC